MQTSLRGIWELKCLPQVLQQRPLAGKVLDVWSLKWGLPQKLSSRDLGGVCQLRTQGDQVLAPTGRDLWPWSGRVFCFPNAVSGPTWLDWNRSCVPHTSGPKVPWRVFKETLGVSTTPHPRWPGFGADWKASLTSLCLQVIIIKFSPWKYLLFDIFWHIVWYIFPKFPVSNIK